MRLSTPPPRRRFRRRDERRIARAAGEQGQALLPSVVRYQPGSPPVVGGAAKRSAAQAPHDTIASVKRFMGRGPADLAKDGTAQRFGQYRFAPATSEAAGIVRFLVAGDRGPASRSVTPIEEIGRASCRERVSSPV